LSYTDSDLSNQDVLYAPFVRHVSFVLPDRCKPIDIRVLRAICNPRISYKKYIFHKTYITTNTNIVSNLLYYTNTESKKQYIFTGLHTIPAQPKYDNTYLLLSYLETILEDEEEYIGTDIIN
jgi:hypothetical protein